MIDSLHCPRKRCIHTLRESLARESNSLSGFDRRDNFSVSDAARARAIWPIRRISVSKKASCMALFPNATFAHEFYVSLVLCALICMQM